MRLPRAIAVTAVVCLATGAAARADTPQPDGDAGGWKLTFDDEFSGTSLDTSKWTALSTPYVNNNINPSPANVSESRGTLKLTLSQAGTADALGTGAQVTSSPNLAPDGYDVPVGGFVEARIYFPGDGTTVYDWPTFWLSSEGNTWPANGEEDVFEGLGTATSNYHYDPDEVASLVSNATMSGTIPGTWTNGYHVYGVLRGALEDTIYWDGQPVYSYVPHDLGGPQQILLTAGSSTGPDAQLDAPTATGDASEIRVGYVRAWTPSDS